ncbi:MAG TPA: hypothetical protein VEY92_01180 [Pseudoxanthomonas sp.]|nr:hypothetical protein [Pseudoxanthomonas sp.]
MSDTELSGPDFLDNVADVESGHGLHINAAEYRTRAAQWRREQARLRDIADHNQALVAQLTQLREHLTRANAVLSRVTTTGAG